MHAVYLAGAGFVAAGLVLSIGCRSYLRSSERERS
jgi:hypothetical protein